jgi:hypothetical protein
LEFLADTILYQKLATQFFPDPLDAEKTEDFLEKTDKIPLPKKPEGWQKEKYEDGLDLVKKQCTELWEKYISPGAPRQIVLPSEIVKALAQLIDMVNSNPNPRAFFIRNC